MIEIENLSVGYDDKEPALWDLNFTLPEGKLIGIFGPNGAGKSTLVKTAVGLIEPIYGRVLVRGEPIKRAGFVPQKNAVDWSFPATALDVVLMGAYSRLGPWRWPSRADRAGARALLERLEMGAFADRPIQHLSEGQKQRVFIARALCQEADIYFMDEPFAGIDLASEQVIYGILRALADEGKTVVVVHHDLKEAAERFDWLVFLNMRLIASGVAGEILTQEVLEKTYGKSQVLFQQATQLAKERSAGAR